MKKSTMRTGNNAKSGSILGADIKEMRKFSFGFALLNFFTYFVMAIFLAMMGLKLNRINEVQALIAVLGILLFGYFAIPKFAKKTMEGIALLKKAKAGKFEKGSFGLIQSKN